MSLCTKRGGQGPKVQEMSGEFHPQYAAKPRSNRLDDAPSRTRLYVPSPQICSFRFIQLQESEAYGERSRRSRDKIINGP